jgi:hypothetical protein
MARKKTQPAPQTPQPQTTHEGITRITIGGFKSFASEQSIDIKPLTMMPCRVVCNGSPSQKRDVR